MSSPFVTLTFGRIKPGKFDEYAALGRLITETVEATEPRVIAFHSFASADRETFASVQVHPDAASMEFHLQVVRELMQNALDFLEVDAFKVLGPSSEMLDGFWQAMASTGTDFAAYSDHVSGFTRSSAPE